MEKQSLQVAAIVTALAPAMFVSGCAEVAADGNDRAARTVKVVCEYPGASAEDVASDVASPVEVALSGLARVAGVSSVSRPGRATVWVEFTPGTGRYEARQAVAGRLQRAAARLPEEAALSLAAPPSGTWLLVAVSERSPAETDAGQVEQAGRLRGLADSVVRGRLLAAAGVSTVTVTGGLRKRYEVHVSPDRLVALDVTLPEVARAIQRANSAVVPGAEIESKERLIGTAGELTSAQDIADIVIAARQDRPVRVADVAAVRVGWTAGDDPGDGTNAAGSLSRSPGVIVAVQVSPDAEGRSVSRGLDEVIEQIQHRLPRGVKIERRVGPRFDAVVARTIQRLERELPPGLGFQQRSTEQLGDHLVVGKTDRGVVMLIGPDSSELGDKAEDVLSRLRAVPGIEDLQASPRDDAPQLELNVDREALARFGVTISELSDVFRTGLGEKVVAEVRDGDHSRAIVLRAGEPEANAAALGSLCVRTESGSLVPLRELAAVQLKSSPRVVYRENLQPAVVVSWRVKDGARSDVRPAVRSALAPVRASLEGLDGDYRVEFRD